MRQWLDSDLVVCKDGTVSAQFSYRQPERGCEHPPYLWGSETVGLLRMLHTRKRGGAGGCGGVE